MHPENPFMQVREGLGKTEDPTVEGRLARVPELGLDECQAALDMPHLQATVRAAVKRRMNQLIREERARIDRAAHAARS
ncbi:hypothetical protein [Thioalkalivibrio sp. ALMg9]|uniref:hypothetical protein n=1 Tax=Thioalkalivibrio sp. ALMg9 TaxID=1266912 RepID=UPI00037D0FEC|nr:hypothetical protein [Thioalkalivibrio sp. ALMg9]